MHNQTSMNAWWMDHVSTFQCVFPQLIEVEIDLLLIYSAHPLCLWRKASQASLCLLETQYTTSSLNSCKRRNPPLININKMVTWFGCASPFSLGPQLFRVEVPV